MLIKLAIGTLLVIALGAFLAYRKRYRGLALGVEHMEVEGAPVAHEHGGEAGADAAHLRRVHRDEDARLGRRGGEGYIREVIPRPQRPHCHGQDARVPGDRLAVPGCVDVHVISGPQGGNRLRVKGRNRQANEPGGHQARTPGGAAW